ncbi:MAG: glycosyltransferase family 39 protein, partial [Pedobacter sp.]
MITVRSYLLEREYPALRDLCVLTVVFGNAFFLLLGRVGLIEPDEGRYAEIPREMLERHDFITPTLNYVAYFEKPPLHYWLTALSFKLFGLSEFAARFAGTMAGLLTVLLVYYTARKLWGRREAILSALVLATSTGFLVQSRINLTDMTLTFCLSAALCCFMIAAENKQHKGYYYHLFYLASGLSILAKGLIGLVFPIGIIFSYMFFSRRWQLLREMYLPSGILLLLSITAPWFVLVAKHNQDFVGFFFIHEHFERFFTTVHGRYQPFWFFAPILLLTMLPWSFYVLRALTHGLRSQLRQDGDPRFFLALWVLFIFVFFSASNSKLIPYILPTFPPLAMLIGVMFAGFLEDNETKAPVAAESRILAALVIVAATGVAGYSWLPKLAPMLIQNGLLKPAGSLVTKPPIMTPTGGAVLCFIFMTMGVTALWSIRRKNILALFIGLCFSSYLLEVVGQHFVLERIAYKKSSRELGLLARELVMNGSVLASFGYEQSLPFYTQRRVVVVGGKGELEFGSKRGDQTAWFIDENSFLKLWQGKRQVVTLLKKSEYEHI